MKSMLYGGIGLACLVFAPTSWGSDPVTITLLHTNDVHSHFHSELNAQGLGGVARLKTAIDRARAAAQASVLVDGGDWSEGQGYYRLGQGRESIAIMNDMGYDVAVVGNHDWLNGPQTLLDSIDDARAKFPLVGANFDAGAYSQAERFRSHVLPYVIRDVGGARIAFIGLVTYEHIYDKYVLPVKITDPIPVVSQLARSLKPQVDAIVAISHNSIAENKKVLASAPDVDLVIGAHDHVMLTEPVVVTRSGHADGWVVETGCWGRYLGQVQLRVGGGKPAALLDYHLTQIDQRLPEDPKIAGDVAAYDEALAQKLGLPSLDDQVGVVADDLPRSGMESPMGDFVADAYRANTGADLAIDQMNFVYGELHSLKPVRMVDLLNANPAVYDPAKSKSWSVYTMSMKGSTLSWLLNFFFASKSVGLDQALAVSGLDIVFKPLFFFADDVLVAPTPELTPETKLGAHHGIIIKSIRVNGQNLSTSQRYKVALGGGIIEAFRYIQQTVPGVIDLSTLQDTGTEAWRAMADALHARSPLKLSDLGYGERIRTQSPDLGTLASEATWDGHTLRAIVHNFGAGPTTSTATLKVSVNRAGSNLATNPQWDQLALPAAIPVLQPGQATKIEFSVSSTLFPRDPLGVVPVLVEIDGSKSDINPGNDTAIVWLPAAS